MRSRLAVAVLAGAVLTGLCSWGAPSASAQANGAFQIGQAGPRKDSRPPARRGPLDKRGFGREQRQPALNDTLLRLMELSPDRRREAIRDSPRLRNMPPRQRAELLGRLDRFDRMSVDDRELLMQRYQLFSRLRPEQQSRARALYRDWAKLPRERRMLMTRGIQRLRRMQPDERAAAMKSDAFVDRFTDSEREMLRELAGLVDDRP